MKKNKYKFFSIFLSILLIFSSSITAFASDYGGGGTSHDADFSNFNEFTPLQKASCTLANFGCLTLSVVGAVLSGGILGNARDAYYDWMIDQKKIIDMDSYGEYVNSHIIYDDEKKELSVDATFSDDLHDALKDYLDANTGWYNVDTWGYQDITPSGFLTKSAYEEFVKQCKALKGNEIIVLKNTNAYTSDFTGVTEIAIQYFKANADSFVLYGSYNGDANVSPYYEWEKPKYSVHYILYSNGSLYDSDISVSSSSFALNTPGLPYPHNDCIITSDGQTRRVYKSVDDMRQYSVGQQPYYTTSKWSNYVPGNGNTITQQEFNSPITYNDIVNNISGDTTINNGITPEQLEKIIDAIIEAMKNNGGGGSGGGDGGGDSGGGSSGGGLAALLAGLGKLGDAILSIVGKLIEYIGKALELVSSSILSIIDVIPRSYSQLITAMFPFFPEEWVTAISLSLVLALIAGIVGIFKK